MGKLRKSTMAQRRAPRRAQYQRARDQRRAEELNAELCKAVSLGDLTQVGVLLQRGANVNIPGVKLGYWEDQRDGQQLWVDWGERWTSLLHAVIAYKSPACILARAYSYQR